MQGWGWNSIKQKICWRSTERRFRIIMLFRPIFTNIIHHNTLAWRIFCDGRRWTLASNLRLKALIDEAWIRKLSFQYYWSLLFLHQRLPFLSAQFYGLKMHGILHRLNYYDFLTWLRVFSPTIDIARRLRMFSAKRRNCRRFSGRK